MSAKSRKPVRQDPPDDLFGAIPATPQFDAFPKDLIARLTGEEAVSPAGSGHPVTPFRVSVPSVKADREKEGASVSVASGTPVEQSGPTRESGCEVQQAEPPVSSDSPARPTEPSLEAESRTQRHGARIPPSRPTVRQTEPADEPIMDSRRTDPADRPGPGDGYRNKLQPKGPHRTKTQRQLLSYLSANGNHITTYTLIADETGVPVGTIRDILRKFEQAGLIRKAKHVQGGLQGLRITLAGELGAGGGLSTGGSGTPSRLSNPTVGSRSLKERFDSHLSVQAGTPAREPGAEEARFRLLALSDEDIAFHYPHVAHTGFGREQMGQVVARLDQLGKGPERVATALEHADFELGQGPLRDKDGQPVANPCGYLFNSLARTGYYRRPPGFVSGEEQAALDAEEEAKARRAARERTARADFEAWRAGLGQAELARALSGCKGPEEQWLRHYYETKARTRD